MISASENSMRISAFSVTIHTCVTFVAEVVIAGC